MVERWPDRMGNSELFSARIPGSKSYTNRALVLAAQRVGETIIRGALHSDDTDLLAAGLSQFGGLRVDKTPDGYRVIREPGRLMAPTDDLYIGGAGTPARFLLSFAAMAAGDTTIVGNRRLNERPMADLLRAFDTIGVKYTCLRAPDFLPIQIMGGAPARRHWSVNGSVSSQFTSSLLLLAAQQNQAAITVTVTGHLVSRPYVNMTVRMMRACGIQVAAVDDQTFAVTPAEPSRPEIQIEPDASAMSYFLAAAALTRSSVEIAGIGSDSAQGDTGLVDVLRHMGCAAIFDDKRLILRGTRQINGVEVDMETMPDTVLTLAALAATVSGTTRITNIANLRVKESDRIHAAAVELSKLGADVEEGPDFLTIRSTGRLRPTAIDTYDDHRVAMAFGVLTLITEGITIKNPECVGKSFPQFWDELDRLRNHLVSLVEDTNPLNAVG